MDGLALVRIRQIYAYIKTQTLRRHLPVERHVQGTTYRVGTWISDSIVAIIHMTEAWYAQSQQHYGAR